MNVTLTQIAAVAPDVAGRLREAIREGRLQAQRRPGVAGRPYVIQTEDLVKVDRSLESLAKRLESQDGAFTVAATGSRGRRAMLHAEAGMGMDVGGLGRVITLMEAQAGMMRTLMDAVARENQRREDRLDRLHEELQQLSYKLGQAHQEIARLERHVAERQVRMPRAEEA